MRLTQNVLQEASQYWDGTLWIEHLRSRVKQPNGRQELVNKIIVHSVVDLVRYRIYSADRAPTLGILVMSVEK
jgi:hypothetical protein